VTVGAEGDPAAPPAVTRIAIAAIEATSTIE
jgi:hypothetical protein